MDKNSQIRENGEDSEAREEFETISKSKILSLYGAKFYFYLCYRFTDQALFKIISAECEEVKRWKGN